MGVESENLRVPRLSRADLAGLQIGPFEGYVLSRVDGKATTQEIADATGAEVPDVIKLVEQLRELGAAEWVGSTESKPLRITTRPPPPPEAGRVLYDPSELYEADVELGEERRRAILDTFYRLEELNYYQLLKVSRKADKAAIRESYFKMSKQFHPDTLFGKKLGTFKAKMEAVFNAITSAYEVLGKKKKRVDYDLYLGLTETTRAAEWDLAQTEEDAVALEASQVPSEPDLSSSPSLALRSSAPESDPGTPNNESATETAEDNQSESEAAQTSGRSAIPPEPDPQPSDDSETSPPLRRSQPAAMRPLSTTPPAERTLAERRQITRELMRRRLAGASGRKSEVKRPTQANEAKPERSRADVLRGLAGSLRSAAQVTGGVDGMGAQVRMARAAEEEGDLLAATNGYRLALSMGDDPLVRADYERVRTILASQLAETYEKQAGYEEEYDKWGAAALSWKKVAEGRPNSAEPLWRAANAIVRSGGDLKHAKELATEAVRLMPTNKQCRIVLAQVFLAAGMKRSAKSELEEAGKLDPSDEIVKNLLLDLRD